MKKLKDKEFWLRIASALLVFVMSYMGVKFANAGDSYQQAEAFRIFCICFSALVLVNLPAKDTLTLTSLIYIPLCYVATHIGYERHIIPDTCDYQFVYIIRLGKGVILGWGLMLLAVLRYIIREDPARRFFIAIKERKPLAKALPLLWCLYAIVLTVVNPGYAYVIVFTIGFSCVFIICGRKEVRGRLFKAYLDGTLLCFLVLTERALRHRPYDTERYLFYFSNENMAGMYLATVLVGLAVRLSSAWQQREATTRYLGSIIRLVLLHILLVWCAVLVLFNYSRTYLLGMGFAFLVYFVIGVIRSKKKGRFVLRFALPVVLSILCMYPGYLVIRYTPALFDSPVYFYGEAGNMTRVQPGDPADSPRYTSLARYFTLTLGKWGIDLHIEDTEEQAQLAEEEGVVTINEDRDVSNGRTWVWSLFLPRMRMSGHYPGHVELEDGHVIFHAHNTYFQNAFQYGIPAGLLFALLIFCAFVYACICNLKLKRVAPSLQFAMLALGTMMLGMLTEWSGHPVYPFGMFWMIAMSALLYEDLRSVESKAQKQE